MTRCFVYLRVSGLAQVEGDGFTRQLIACEEYARRNELEIVRVFREEAISGKSELDNRPALRELLAELMADGVKVVLIEKLDRLARSLIVQETILQDFQRRQFQVISVCEADVTSEDPTRVLIRQILGAFFEYERKMISNKLAAARQRIRLKTGKCEGRKAYGTAESEKQALRSMRALRLAGQTYQMIATQLNSQHVPTREGGLWTAQTVGKILIRDKSDGSLRSDCHDDEVTA
jgi:DNA invertase Pin-like site-specific DNA recombinase